MQSGLLKSVYKVPYVHLHIYEYMDYLGKYKYKTYAIHIGTAPLSKTLPKCDNIKLFTIGKCKIYA